MRIDLDELERLAKAATPQNIDAAEIIEGDEGKTIECPVCCGEGYVSLEGDYCNFDGCAIGVQFYGIGNEHGAAERFYRAANPATVLELVRRLREAESTLNEISGIAHIGTEARKPFVIIENVKNMSRRSECLSAIERQFFTSVITDDDGEESEDCPLNWGDDPVEYAKNFGELFSVINAASATPCQGHAQQQEAEEIEQLRKDADRYRWLRHNSGFSIAERLFGEQSMSSFIDAELDALIDGELAQEAKSGE